MCLSIPNSGRIIMILKPCSQYVYIVETVIEARKNVLAVAMLQIGHAPILGHKYLLAAEICNVLCDGEI